MSAVEIVCAVAVPLLWGYQFVAIKVGVTQFPPLFFLALRFLAIAHGAALARRSGARARGRQRVAESAPLRGPGPAHAG